MMSRRHPLRVSERDYQATLVDPRARRPPSDSSFARSGVGCGTRPTVSGMLTIQPGTQTGTFGHPGPGLPGRGGECDLLDRLIEAVRGGASRTLIVRGEPGVGKTALLDYMAGRASACRVVRAVGVQSEMELAFAALHQLCAPMLDRLERLPVPQRDALRTAFGLRLGSAPDRFFVALAVLSLLSEVAEERPLVCVVDDAQWLDQGSAQVLAFAARRLLAEPVGLIFAAREPGEQFRGLPDLEVRGLPHQHARALLDSAVRVRLDEQVWDRIVDETNGNPLALLELPRGLSPTQLAGGFGLAGGAGGPGPDRAGLPGAARGAARRHAVADAGRGGGAGRGPGAGPAGGRAARDRGFGGGGRFGRRIARHRCAGAVPASAGAVGGVLGGVGAGAAGGGPRR